MEQQSEQSLFDMNMDSNTQSSLLAISKWSKFIAITGFVMGALCLLFLAAYGVRFADQLTAILSIGGSDMASIILVVVILVLLLVGCWLFFLFKASSLLKKGLQTRDTATIADGFKAMKSYFIFSFIISLLGILSTIQEII